MSVVKKPKEVRKMTDEEAYACLVQVIDSMWVESRNDIMSEIEGQIITSSSRPEVRRNAHELFHRAWVDASRRKDDYERYRAIIRLKQCLTKLTRVRIEGEC